MPIYNFAINKMAYRVYNFVLYEKIVTIVIFPTKNIEITYIFIKRNIFLHLHVCCSTVK